MTPKLHLNLPVCLDNGTPARIICTDRKTEYPVVFLGDGDAVYVCTLDGTSGTCHRRLINKAQFDGMKPNPGYKPDDWDDTRPVLLSNGGLARKEGVGRWSFTGMDDVAFYWPKPKPITLELTPEEAATLAVIVRHVAGPIEGPRGHVAHIRDKLPEQAPHLSNVLMESGGQSIRFRSNAHNDPYWTDLVDKMKPAG